MTKSKKIRFSPHQIAFHKRHPDNTFIMVKALGPLPKKTFSVSLFRGSRIFELAACGLALRRFCPPDERQAMVFRSIK